MPSQSLGRYALELIRTPPCGLTQPGLLSTDGLQVIDDGAGLAEALVSELNGRGVDASVVEGLSSDGQAVVYLGGLSPVTDEDAAMALNARAFEVIKSLAPRLNQPGGALVVAYDTGGRFAIDEVNPVQAYTAGLAALARTAALEWPQSSVKCIDMQRADRSTEALVLALADEIVMGGPQREVGLSADGGRWTLSDERVAAPSGEVILTDSDVVVVSGGARGVTAACVVALAKESKSRFVLLGRTALTDELSCYREVTGDAELKRAVLGHMKEEGLKPTPAEIGRTVRSIMAGREIRRTLSEIHQSGAEAVYMSVDVTDVSGLNEVMAAARKKWGPITSLIHGAGVLADKRIEDKSLEDFNWVFNTKVAGLKALLQSTADDPLRAIVLFSSVAGRCGNVGQVDYAMANEVLNKVAVAAAAQRSGCRVRALGWGPWEGGMVTPALRARFTELGVPMIPIDIGAQMLVSELRAGPDAGPVGLVLGGRPRPAALLSGDQATDMVTDIWVDRAQYGHLSAHAIDGKVVVPVVMVVEWFARAARVYRPDLKLSRITDVKVLKGIQLDNFESSGARFELRCRQVANGDGVSLAMELSGADGCHHYMATGELVRRRGRPNQATEQPPLEAWGERDIYGGVLFHGPEFQVIQQVDGISDDGMTATLGGVETMGWPKDEWRTDVAAMDGGLQLALLWSQRVLGGASLPTGIEQVCTWTDEPPTGSVKCVLVARETGRSKAVSDLAFVDAGGRVVAEMKGVQTHLLPR